MSVEEIRSVRVALGGGTHCRDVAPCVWFRKPKGGQGYPLCLWHEISALLRFSTELQQSHRGQSQMHRQQRPKRGIASLKFFGDDSQGDKVEAEATVHFGNRRSEPAQPGYSTDDILIDPVAEVVFLSDRKNAFLDKATHGLL